MNDWKPISEAPVSHDKYLDDVCRCFVYGPSTGIQMGRAWRYPDGRCRAVTLAFTGDNDITHWMPFPTAPTSHPIPTGATGDRDWELACDNCNGSGHVFVKHQVAERKTDVQEFKEECEACEGRGFNIAFEDIPGIAEYVKSCRAAPSVPVDAQGDDSDIPELRSEAEIAFEGWLTREMPGGTIISNPAWWAPRILLVAKWILRAKGDLAFDTAAGDAARYRWLKERNGGPIGIVAWHRDEEQEMVLVDEHADAAIDAAIAQQSQRKEA